MSPTFDGLLVIDKPVAMTSRDAVNRASRWFPRRQHLGHAGTLDPLATGVLVLCLGSATRLVEYVQDMSKVYRSVFRLGAISDTDDAEGCVTEVATASDPGLDAVRAALSRFVGRIEQLPPAYSAAKVGGKRSYDLARKGVEIALTPRVVEVYGLDVLRYAYPEVEVEVRCGKGTYVRSLARDLGQTLGCGGYVEKLTRTRVGPFTVEQAAPLNLRREEARQRVLPRSQALAELPQVLVPVAELESLSRGQGARLPAELPADAAMVAVSAGNEATTVVARVDRRLRVLRPVKVIK